jgi:hypothetical protein
MTVIAFDTLAYANKLKEGGMEARLADIQADETAKILSDLATNQLATKNDLNIIKGDLNTLKTELLKEIHLNTWKIIGLLAGLQAIFHFIK